MLFACVFVYGLTSFLYLDPNAARKYVRRWRPQQLGDTLVSVSGIHCYTRAIIQLHKEDCIGMVSNVRDVAFVLHGGGDRDPFRDFVACCLWRTGPSVEEFRDLHEWYETMMPKGRILDGSLLFDQVEREMWREALSR